MAPIARAAAVDDKQSIAKTRLAIDVVARSESDGRAVARRQLRRVRLWHIEADTDATERVCHRSIWNSATSRRAGCVRRRVVADTDQGIGTHQYLQQWKESNTSQQRNERNEIDK